MVSRLRQIVEARKDWRHFEIANMLDMPTLYGRAAHSPNQAAF